MGPRGCERAGQDQHRVAELVGQEARSFGVGGGGGQQVGAGEGGEQREMALVRGVGPGQDAVDDARAEGRRDDQIRFAGAGALVETSRRAIRRSLIRRRRIRAMRRSRMILARMGLAAAFAGMAFMLRGAATMR